jgi:hypothetical protein
MSTESRWWNAGLIAAILALAGSILALAGNVYITRLQIGSAERQAHQKAQSELVVEAIRTGDPKRAAKNLLFLVNLGLLDDPGGRMKTALSNPDNVPVLPVPQARGYGQGGFGQGGYGGTPDPPDRPPK